MVFALPLLALATSAFAAPAPYDLVTLLQLNPDASTLVTAVVAANLATTLSGKGPFTIFAPDNRAFEALPPGVLPELLKNKTLLTEVLTYHVVSGNVSSSDLTNNEDVQTLLPSGKIHVELHKGPNGQSAISLDQYSFVTYPNNFGTNGVYHVIDRVLRPEAMSPGLAALFAAADEAALIRPAAAALPALNLVQRLQYIPEFSTLVTAVVAGNLAGALSGAGPFTLFAPSNRAFERLPPGALEKLLANKTALVDVLTYHVAKGNVSSSDLTNNEQVPTLEGKNILVQIFQEPRPQPHAVVVLDKHSLVDLPDNYATNGVFHGIDEVLLPPA